MTDYETTLQPTTTLFSLPLILMGLFLVVVALLFAAWPANYQDPPRSHFVSHWERLTGNDLPENITEVERTGNYRIRRTLDAVIYYMVIQGIIAIIGLAWLEERFLYWLLMVSGLYGVVYAMGIGLIIGAMITLVGSTLILWGAIIGWLAANNTKVTFNGQKHFITES